MNKIKARTILRTIRIPYKIDQILQNDANTKRVSINSLSLIYCQNILNGIDIVKDLVE
jgi:hypothetical protein